MSKRWKITIAGFGPCLGGEEVGDADEGAKQLVQALKHRGHEVTQAEFSGGGKPPMDINVEPEPRPAPIVEGTMGSDTVRVTVGGPGATDVQVEGNSAGPEPKTNSGSDGVNDGDTPGQA